MKLESTPTLSKININKSEGMIYASRNEEKFKETCFKNRLKRKNKKK